MTREEPTCSAHALLIAQGAQTNQRLGDVVRHLERLCDPQDGMLVSLQRSVAQNTADVLAHGQRIGLVEEQARVVGRARIVGSWATWAALGAGGLVASGVWVYELGSRHAWW